MTDLCTLDDYGILAVAGRDAAQFLQGYVTSDLETFNNSRPQALNRPQAPNEPQTVNEPRTINGPQALPGAICNIKGRMVTSFIMVRRDDTLLLRMHRPLVASAIKFLGKYIVFSKADMADVSDEWHCYGAPGSGGGLNSSQEPGFALTQSPQQVNINLGYGEEIWSRTPLAANMDATTWQNLEVANEIAWVQLATSELFLPQMFNYHNWGGVDFDKGCYLGQEVVA
ncbi:MAG: YgfZ/GcvT domain-containing protein, partial [Pseudomonadales bacterium]